MAVKIDFDEDFDVQVAQARAQRVMLPNDFYRLPAEKRAQAFTVSGLARLDQVQAVADALAKFQADGGTFEDFRKWAAGQDWSLPRHRLETIYRNAVQTAYMAGHWRRFDEVKEAFPYLMYDAINDSRVRPSHLAMDGVIRPVDDPIWKRWTPPCGHRCRCSLRSVSAREAQRRGGATQSIPAEAVPDEGWGNDPRDAWRGYRAALDGRFAQCATSAATLAKGGRIAQPLWCKDGPIRDFALMQQAWIERRGEMPAPRPLNLPETLVQPGSEREALDEFMQAFGGGATARVTLLSGDVVVVSDDLFRTLDGRWKIGKRERDRWLGYIAALIKAPQEIWRLELGSSQELYLLGRFLRGRQRIDALAVFKRERSGHWVDGKTAYVFDNPAGLDKKRAELLSAASLSWLER
jgi:SPP1 gp7 family putative phage head morphogenesis protein